MRLYYHIYSFLTCLGGPFLRLSSVQHMSKLQLPSVLAARRPPAHLVLATVTARPATSFDFSYGCLFLDPKTAVKSAQSTARQPGLGNVRHIARDVKELSAQLFQDFRQQLILPGAPGARGFRSVTVCWLFVKRFHYVSL